MLICNMYAGVYVLYECSLINVYVYETCLMKFETCLCQLANTEEYIDGAQTGNLGEVLIRCNNVLYIRGVEEEDEEGEMKDW